MHTPSTTPQRESFRVTLSDMMQNTHLVRPYRGRFAVTNWGWEYLSTRYGIGKATAQRLFEDVKREYGLEWFWSVGEAPTAEGRE